MLFYKVKFIKVFVNSFLCVYRKMDTRRMASRRIEEGRMNEEIPPQLEQVIEIHKIHKVHKFLKVLKFLLKVKVIRFRLFHWS